MGLGHRRRSGHHQSAVTTTESGINPKFEADYHLTPDQMVYANAAKGFRPGGLVPIVPPGQAGHRDGLRRGP